ncbi:Nn.00g089510.m01.CDS01 [Neocucurbitaria sp. VM-36]
MASAQDVQSLLRFLSQDAKVPLAQALSKVRDLQAAKLVTAPDLSKADFEKLKTIFGDEKIARQVLNAAKRVSKKRTSSDDSALVPAPSPKKTKPLYGQPLNPVEFEASLALPEVELDEEKLKSAIIYTNRAPLVLAFACTLLKYTMPEQPVSSRLSLAQAVTSMNSKNKAIHVGLDSGHAAEDEGWGEGQPIVRIMTRDVRVMKRWGYEWEEQSTQETLKSSQDTLVEEPTAKDPPLWGVDLEALKKANQPGAVGSYKGVTSQLPIYTAQSARAYLMKAFETPKVEGTAPAKRTHTAMAAEKERNLSLLLGALELLYQSWSHVLSREDLDKRAWGWYVRTRPDVAHGAAGWGGKGNVKLSDILELRRPSG